MQSYAPNGEKISREGPSGATGVILNAYGETDPGCAESALTESGGQTWDGQLGGKTAALSLQCRYRQGCKQGQAEVEGASEEHC